MKNKIIGILVSMLFILTSLSFVSAEPATDSEITSFDSEITITKPNGYVYIITIPIAALPAQGRFSSIVLGKIDVEVEVNTSVDKVEFYVDDELKDVDTVEPYTWEWAEKMMFPPIHTLKVIGYDGDVEVGIDEVGVLYLNPFNLIP
jgi:hypothetical protein